MNLIATTRKGHKTIHLQPAFGSDATMCGVTTGELDDLPMTIEHVRGSKLAVTCHRCLAVVAVVTEYTRINSKS